MIFHTGCLLGAQVAGEGHAGSARSHRSGRQSPPLFGEQQDREAEALSRVGRRLQQQFPELPPEAVEAVVNVGYHIFDGRPIRDFIPILVEHAAREISMAVIPRQHDERRTQQQIHPARTSVTVWRLARPAVRPDMCGLAREARRPVSRRRLTRLEPIEQERPPRTDKRRPRAGARCAKVARLVQGASGAGSPVVTCAGLLCAIRTWDTSKRVLLSWMLPRRCRGAVL
jgi:hypothetical protein